MIPRDYITEWRAHAPWVQDFQVEQDLVISRALITIFTHPVLVMAHGGHNVTRDAFEQNLGGKLLNAQFNADIGPLLTTGFSWYSQDAMENIRSRLIARLPE